jgi:glutaredoxin
VDALAAHVVERGRVRWDRGVIVVWGRAGCGPCIAVKSALNAHSVPYVARDLADATPADHARWASLGMKGTSAPVVEHAGGAFAGFIPARVQTLIDMRR